VSWETLGSLRADAFLMDKVNNHNPAFGYNTFEGFIEEDCVQALEQIINENSKWKLKRVNVGKKMMMECTFCNCVI
jgi:hypothetical protein